MKYKELKKLEEEFKKGYLDWVEELQIEVSEYDVRESIIEQEYKGMGCEVQSFNDNRIILQFYKKDRMFCEYDITKKSYDFTTKYVENNKMGYMNLVIDKLLEKGLI